MKRRNLKAATVSHLICAIGLASSFWLAINVFSINLIQNPVETLRLLWLIEVPVVILVYSFFRKDKTESSYLKAAARGLLGLPVGAVVNALGAIALGAPVGSRYFLRTLNWSLLMSVLTFVPAASVYGSSWDDWHRIFAQTKLMEFIDYMICVPAYGAVIGAWFGAWPMPLDWERLWQLHLVLASKRNCYSWRDPEEKTIHEIDGRFNHL